MLAYQRDFIDLAVSREALLFGEFKLKSGRISPYFFNAGRFCDGASLNRLGSCYADAVVASGIQFDFLFGPAYKGIPLAVASAMALAQRHDRPTPWCFNRKEAKDHGEGGTLVGAPAAGRVLIVDDVITAGTAIRDAAAILRNAGATLAGVILGLDRRERGQGARSATQEVAEELDVPVMSIIAIDHIIEYLDTAAPARVAALRDYRSTYGV
ncbi:MAG: orotate phosphoribosyltransferase [Gammaproteobacteria bacterium]